MLARVAPGGPEIHQHQRSSRGLDHVAAEGRRCRVLDDIGCAWACPPAAFAVPISISIALLTPPSIEVAGLCFRAGSCATRGSWPVARMNRKRSFTRNVCRRCIFQRMTIDRVWCINSASMMTLTKPLRSLTRLNAVTEPGGMPSTSINSSGLPKLSLWDLMVVGSDFKSTCVLAPAMIRKRLPLASFRNKFLVGHRAALARPLCFQRR